MRHTSTSKAQTIRGVTKLLKSKHDSQYKHCLCVCQTVGCQTDKVNRDRIAGAASGARLNHSLGTIFSFEGKDVGTKIERPETRMDISSA